MSNNVNEIHLESQKFFKITHSAYLIGLIGHVSAIFLFWYIEVPEMAIINAVFSGPVFALALLLNKRGYTNLAFSMASLELLLHQV
jgi:hypothetical protein